MSLAEEESVPLPELSEDSKILEQLHIRKVHYGIGRCTGCDRKTCGIKIISKIAIILTHT